MSRARSAAVAYMTLLRQRSGGASVPVNSVEPSVDTTPVVLTALDYTAGTWTDADSVSAQAWRATTEGGTYTTIGSAWDADGGTPYTPQDSDFGYWFKVIETAQPGDVTAESAAVGPVVVDADFSALSDGALPSYLAGATWAVSSGKAVNTPTLGANLLTDPGLEGTYTSGKANALTMAGTPTLSESADTHGGTKAQQFIGDAVAESVNWAAAAGVAGVWYQFGVWGKRTAGSANNVGVVGFQTNGLPVNTVARKISEATYARQLISWISTSTANVFAYAARQLAAGNPSDTVIVDDGTRHAITYSSLFALTDTGVADVVVKAQPDTMADGTLFGLVLRADAATDPTDCVFVIARWHQSTDTILALSVVKKVGSTYSLVLAETTVTMVADAWLEVRSSGNTVQVFYNGTQRGADLTISDADLVSNTCHGVFSSGGNSIKRFFSEAN